MANDLWGGEVSREQAVQALASITGRNFPDLGSAWGDSTIGGALSNANGTDRGPLGSCVYQVSGESWNRCLDNLTEDQARDGFSGRWDQFRSCDLRESERVRPTPPAYPTPPSTVETGDMAEPAAPSRPARKAKPRPAKPAKKKAVVKKRTPARAAKRAPAAARTKPKKKVAAKAKRRPAKAAAKKKTKRTAKKAKRR